MMRSPGGQEPDSLAPLYSSVLKHFQDDLAEQIDFQQMFVLIEGVLPFEVCLYYQVLPLFVDGSRMFLGMVSPYDRSASNYVRRLISYHHYTVTTRQISSEALQAALSAYLNYAGQHQTLEQVPNQFAPHVIRRSHSKPPLDNTLQPTLVVDSPENLDDALKPSPPAKVESDLPDATAPSQTEEQTPDTLVSAPADRASESATNDGDDIFPPLAMPIETPAAPPPTDDVAANAATPFPALPMEPTVTEGKEAEDLVSHPASAPRADVEAVAPSPSLASPKENAEAGIPAQTSTTQPKLPPLIPPIPTLTLQLNHLSSPVDELATLPPSELVQELLGRVLMKGIGRLYLERQAKHGRVLWSQDGVLQSVLEALPAERFEALINELKQMAALPTRPLHVPQRLDVERIFESDRILLRFRFMPSEHGEEATLQVLRGAALRFYQQQQLMLLERDALGIAKQLQGKLGELRDRAHAESSLSGARLEVLPALSNLLREIEGQIQTMQAAIAASDSSSRRKPDA